MGLDIPVNDSLAVKVRKAIRKLIDEIEDKFYLDKTEIIG
jgi:hypothetical protein